MSELPLDLSIWLIPLISALAAVIGSLVALTSLTQDARLSKRAEMLRAEISTAGNPHDREVLESLHRDTTAEIVALMAVPSRVRLLSMAQYFGALLVATPITGFFLSLELMLSDDPTIFGSASTHLIHIFFVLLFVLSIFWLVNGCSGWIKSGLERTRVARAYLEGRDLDRRLHKWRGLVPGAEIFEEVRESEKTSGRAVRRSYIAHIIALSFFPWIILISATVSLVIYRDWLVVLQAGVALVYILWGTLRGAVSTTRWGFAMSPITDDWVHPRQPSLAEQIQEEIEPVRHTRPQSPRRWPRVLFCSRR